MLVPDTPQALDLPHEKWRPHQREVIQQIVDSTKPIIQVVAPTGAGKSLIAAAIPKVTRTSMLTLTGTKSLQDQYAGDFRHFVSLKGMSNYYCDIPEMRGVRADHAPCTAGYDCPLRGSECTYYDVVHSARIGDSVVTNYAYGSTSLKYQPSSILHSKDWIISDEAHFLDAQLTAGAEAELTSKHFDVLSVRPYGDDPKAWAEWASYNLDSVRHDRDIAYGNLAELVDALDGHVLESPKELVDAKRHHKFYSELAEHLEAVASNESEHNYVLTVTDERVKLRPLWPHHSRLTGDFFAAAPKTVLMSATLPPAAELAQLYGLDVNDIETIEMPSIFPLENRPVFVLPIAKMSYATQMQEIEKCMKVINHMLRENPTAKVLVHTNSYALQRRAADLLAFEHRPRLLMHTSENREMILERFRTSSSPYVLMSPSAESGLDVRDLQLQFILKVLWPSTGDNWVRARMNARPSWYTQAAIDNTVQAIGRAPRDESTVARTFILDSNFRFLYAKNKHRFPNYVREAIEWVDL